MPLDITRMVPKGQLKSVDIRQFADLLLGSMTDQPVTIGNNLRVLVGAVVNRTKPGTPSDADFANPMDGMIVVDTANHLTYFRSGATWRQAGSVDLVSGEHEEFVPAATATFVDLAKVPQRVLTVARDGVVQSQAGGDYSVAGSRITFTDALSGTERIIVAYTSGLSPTGTAVDNEVRIYLQNLMSVLDPGGPPPPP